MVVKNKKKVEVKKEAPVGHLVAPRPEAPRVVEISEKPVIVPVPVIEVIGQKCVCGELMTEVKKNEFRCSHCGKGLTKFSR